MKEAIIINTVFCCLGFIFSCMAIGNSYITQKKLQVKAAEEVIKIIKTYPISAQYFIAPNRLAYIRMGRLALYGLIMLNILLGYWSVQRIETNWQPYASTNIYLAIIVHFIVCGISAISAMLSKGKTFKIFEKLKI